jgi:hypothetical protein
LLTHDGLCQDEGRELAHRRPLSLVDSKCSSSDCGRKRRTSKCSHAPARPRPPAESSGPRSHRASAPSTPQNCLVPRPIKTTAPTSPWGGRGCGLSVGPADPSMALEPRAGEGDHGEDWPPLSLQGSRRKLDKLTTWHPQLLCEIRKPQPPPQVRKLRHARWEWSCAPTRTLQKAKPTGCWTPKPVCVLLHVLVPRHGLRDGS